MVVRTPHIDELFKATAEFVLMICYVRSEIGRLTVAPHHDTIFFVPVSGGFKPERAFLLINKFPVLTFFYHRIDTAGVIKALFTEPVVKPDAECLQIGSDARKDVVCSKTGTKTDDLIFS